jgi:hypothetical protein
MQPLILATAISFDPEGLRTPIAFYTVKENFIENLRKTGQCVNAYMTLPG